MKKVICIICCMAMLLMQVNIYAAAANEIYISPDGSDSNSGTIDNPLKTLAKAVEKVKLYDDGEITIYMRGGEYSARETAVLDSDSMENKKLNIKAYQNEKPIINAGVKAENLRETSDGLITAEVKAEDLRDLYVNGDRAVRGRYPNEGEYLTLERDKTKSSLFIPSGIADNLKQYNGGLEFAAIPVWLNQYIRIKEIKPGKNYTELVMEDIEKNQINNVRQGADITPRTRFWLENAKDFVDSPGEWYFDKKEHLIYYYPNVNETADNIEMYYGLTDSVLRIEGNSKQHISDIEISGIEFRNTGWTRPNNEGFLSLQGNSLLPSDLDSAKDERYRMGIKKEKIPGVIDSAYGDNITIENCSFINTAANAITLEVGGNDINIKNNVFTNIGGTAIEVGGDYYKSNDGDMFHKNINIYNNYFDAIAQTYRGGVGILVRYADGLKIEHNTIKNTSYSGISLGWGWSPSEKVSFAKNYEVRKNYFENCMGEMRDGGSIYITNPIQGKNIIEGNYIRPPYKSAIPIGEATVAIYHDGASANWEDYENVVEYSVTPYMIQQENGHVAENITVRDSYFVLGEVTFTNYDPKDYNIVIANNTYLDSVDYNDKALQIIQNAGLADKSIIPVKDISIDKRDFYKVLDAGYTDEISVEMSNNTDKDIQLEFEVKTPEGIEFSGETISVLPSASKKDFKLKFTSDSECESGNSIIYITVKADGKTILSNGGVAVDMRNFTYNIISTDDEGYSETGSWARSGLEGFKQKTTYGYSKDAQAVFAPSGLPEGEYEVYVYKVYHATSDRALTAEVHDGEKLLSSSVLDFGEGSNGWLDIGRYSFGSENNAYVKLIKDASNENTFLRASAVLFKRIINDDGREKIEKELAVKRLNAPYVFKDGKGYYYKDGIKVRTDAPIKIIGGKAYASAEIFADVINAEVIYKENTVDIVKGTRGIRILKDSDYYEVNGIRRERSSVCGYYIPFSETEIFGIKSDLYENGIVICHSGNSSFEDKLDIALNAFTE